MIKSYCKLTVLGLMSPNSWLQVGPLLPAASGAMLMFTLYSNTPCVEPMPPCCCCSCCRWPDALTALSLAAFWLTATPTATPTAPISSRARASSSTRGRLMHGRFLPVPAVAAAAAGCCFSCCLAGSAEPRPALHWDMQWEGVSGGCRCAQVWELLVEGRKEKQDARGRKARYKGTLPL